MPAVKNRRETKLIKPQCNHRNARIDVFHRTFANVGSERMEDLIALCTECYANFHNHEGCPGCPYGSGCFPEGLTVEDLQELERDVCADIPFEDRWDDKQRERFHLLHNRQVQEAWMERRAKLRTLP